MKYNEFLKAVEDRMGVMDRNEAEQTVVVVLQMLSERLAGGEPKDLLSQLPAELQQKVKPVPSPSRSRASHGREDVRAHHAQR
jgi:uncharacterized protein (DUF2267 family)